MTTRAVNATFCKCDRCDTEVEKDDALQNLVGWTQIESTMYRVADSSDNNIIPGKIDLCGRCTGVFLRMMEYRG